MPGGIGTTAVQRNRGPEIEASVARVVEQHDEGFARNHLAASMSYVCGGSIGDDSDAPAFGHVVDAALLRS